MSAASPAVMEVGSATGAGVGRAVFTGVTSVLQASFSRAIGPDGKRYTRDSSVMEVMTILVALVMSAIAETPPLRAMELPSTGPTPTMKWLPRFSGSAALTSTEPGLSTLKAT